MGATTSLHTGSDRTCPGRNNVKGLYEIMHLRNNYVIGIGRMEIARVISECQEA